MKSTNTVKLVMNKETRKKLIELAITSAEVWNVLNWLNSLCGEAPSWGYVSHLLLCPHIGKVILHIPESLGTGSGGQLPVRDRGNGLKTQPVVYHWTNGVGWVTPTSHEVMRMKVVNHKPRIHPEGTLTLQGGEEVSSLIFDPLKKVPFVGLPSTSATTVAKFLSPKSIPIGVLGS